MDENADDNMSMRVSLATHGVPHLTRTKQRQIVKLPHCVGGWLLLLLMNSLNVIRFSEYFILAGEWGSIMSEFTWFSERN